MKNLFIKNNHGFSTLFVVIVLGSIALSLSLGLSTTSVWSIRGGVDNKIFQKSKSLSNACAEVALEKLREDNSFVGAGSVYLSNNTCNYTVTNTGGDNRDIEVVSIVNGIYHRINISTDAFNPLNISSWQEVN